MFDGIKPNDRIVGSMFDQARTFVVCTAPTAEATRGHMETIYASFTCINISSEKMSQYMEIVSNIQPKKIWAECSTQWPSAHYFRSIIQPNYHVDRYGFYLHEWYTGVGFRVATSALP
jgi:hypothetical protein